MKKKKKNHVAAVAGLVEGKVNANARTPSDGDNDRVSSLARRFLEDDATYS